ncbi:Dol-P-Man:Man(5)GlcNAc(2)-PP-Dol alpha-1,3-mannosyltransferase [Exophiala dermatitidis]|uniref:Dol-P-Man:Man(5)GlcNAc(2)-PP-Dol alpha-1,3-mannosyltransferase n=2 Tax=Exophiala dermatitidis TaxID=5970 RepID=H6C6I6_EXODN|nr:alpha-1,3-mannosyltransferase [Exophiala dermatitidis NIH/UT8656]EHY59332.1 alpha-1,3-mannosyltransferase [Exophiala dermatitidis NIH/UT8656]KAJ4522892.1 dolichyl-P-Man:Man(5)GlcNAc(2)-PP-dolichol alpha-1,3-mannosyltransferase [Exophiala dermatitidis]KAJ4559860.1 dolichyl-P-Man:Man(5)GlcNAc(2)-PP-dolichol alpha-1,3-mannosyltransferase [Exophiala dermatitidis]
MAQVSMFLDGERDYSKITGPTGPLVYPALHVYIYTALYYLTDEGTNILRAQFIFAGLYLVTLAVVLACYRRVGAPPWLLVPLALSKRMHSIFLLRLFNDCWATLALWTAIYLLQRRQWRSGALIWGLGLGVKMTLLLAAPAIGVVVLQGSGTRQAIWSGISVALLHLLLALPFLGKGASSQYFQRAFDFGRQFLFKWTVNWTFVGPETFASPSFAVGLLLLHVAILSVFLQSKWTKPSACAISDFVKKYAGSLREDEHLRISSKITPTFVMDSVLGSMVIGMLCARSLHYQFFAYLGWATPYILWRAGGSPVLVLANWAVQELSWLVFPSTDTSSMLVVAELALQVVCALVAPAVDHISPPKAHDKTS